MSRGREAISCSRCSRHLGWMNYAGPCGSFYCDSCDADDEAEEESAVQDGG